MAPPVAGAPGEAVGAPHNWRMTPPDLPLSRLLWLALALSLGAAVSLGITRFAYALLLPVMREDLGWSYTLAGAMNTANALGYLLGALATPWLMRRWSAPAVLLAGSVLASGFMAASGFFIDAGPLLLQRLLAGAASALVFVAGGLMAARLGAQSPRRAGLLLGLYYGGTGWGIVLSALAVPALLQAAANVPHGWAWAWWALALACLAATAVLARPALLLQKQELSAQSGQAPAAQNVRQRVPCSPTPSATAKAASTPPSCASPSPAPTMPPSPPTTPARLPKTPPSPSPPPTA